MALSRSPTSIQVNGAALLVKGGSGDGILSKWQRVPGLANFTLPDETGGTNEIQLMDGTVAYAQAAGVGSITGNIGAITAHPTHQFLAAKRRASAEQIQVTIIRPATALLTDANDNAVGVGDSDASGKSVVTIDTAQRAIREGMLAAVHTAAPKGLLGYADDEAADMAKYHTILSVDDGFEKFTVSPGTSAAVSKASGTGLYVRVGGILYENILCSVSGFGDGDFQAGGAVNANLAFQPANELARSVEWRTLAELGSSGFLYSGASSTDGDYDAVFADL